jgi:tetratricopeptide (TPR) repeat protein
MSFMKFKVLAVILLVMCLVSCKKEKPSAVHVVPTGSKAAGTIDQGKNAAANGSLESLDNIADDLLKQLKDGRYQEVEGYFNRITSKREKTNDGIPRSWQIYNNLAGHYKNSEIDIFDTWCSTASSPSAFIARAFYHVDDAWRARGSNFARFVSDEQFALFHKRLSLAQKDLEKAYQLKPDDPNIAAKMLTVIRGQGQSNHIRELWFERGKSADSSFFPIYRQKLEDLYPKWGGSWEEAYSFVKTLYDSPPPGSLADTLMLDYIIESLYYPDARSKLAQNDIERNVKDIEKRYYSEYPTGNFITVKKERIYGSLSFMNNNPNDAEIHFKNIIQIDAQYDWAWYMLGQMYQKSYHKSKEAIEYFDKAITLNGAEGMYHNERGIAYRDVGRYQDCIDDLEFSTQKGYKDYATYLSLAICYGGLKDYDNAIKNASKSMEYTKSDYPVIKRAEFNQEKGDIENAIEDYKGLIKHNPNNPTYLKKLEELENEFKKEKHSL